MQKLLFISNIDNNKTLTLLDLLNGFVFANSQQANIHDNLLETIYKLFSNCMKNLKNIALNSVPNIESVNTIEEIDFNKIESKDLLSIQYTSALYFSLKPLCSQIANDRENIVKILTKIGISFDLEKIA